MQPTPCWHISVLLNTEILPISKWQRTSRGFPIISFFRARILFLVSLCAFLASIAAVILIQTSELRRIYIRRIGFVDTGYPGYQMLINRIFYIFPFGSIICYIVLYFHVRRMTQQVLSRRTSENGKQRVFVQLFITILFYGVSFQIFLNKNKFKIQILREIQSSCVFSQTFLNEWLSWVEAWLWPTRPGFNPRSGQKLLFWISVLENIDYNNFSEKKLGFKQNLLLGKFNRESQKKNGFHSKTGFFFWKTMLRIIQIHEKPWFKKKKFFFWFIRWLSGVEGWVWPTRPRFDPRCGQIFFLIFLNRLGQC